jgi:glycosyltransferase involved in cell wall biosynthesis
MKKIAVVVTDPVSGVLFYPVQLCLALANRGYRVSAIASSANKEQTPGLVNSLKKSGISIFYLNELSLPAGKRALGIAVGRYLNFDAFNSSNNFSFNIVLSTGPFVSFQLHSSGFKGSFVTVVNAMGHDGSSWLKQRIGGFLLNLFSDSVIALCNAERKRLEHFGVKSKSIRVVYNPVDVERILTISQYNGCDGACGCFKEISKPNRYVICLASFQPRKQQALIINTFAHSKSLPVDCFLVLAGDGEMLESCKELAQNLEISERVIFLGRVNNDEAVALIKEAELVVHASTHETFGYSMVEPLLLGRPTILSRTGIGFEIDDAGVSTVFDPLDGPEFQSYFDDFWVNPAGYEMKALKGSEYVNHCFRIEKIAEQLVSL